MSLKLLLRLNCVGAVVVSFEKLRKTKHVHRQTKRGLVVWENKPSPQRRLQIKTLLHGDLFPKPQCLCQKKSCSWSGTIESMAMHILACLSHHLDQTTWGRTWGLRVVLLAFARLFGSDDRHGRVWSGVWVGERGLQAKSSLRYRYSTWSNELIDGERPPCTQKTWSLMTADRLR